MLVPIELAGALAGNGVSATATAGGTCQSIGGSQSGWCRFDKGRKLTAGMDLWAGRSRDGG